MDTVYSPKFESNPTPDNALLDLEYLLDLFEEAESDEQRNWARNRLIALRRVFIPVLHEFIDNAITYDLEDFSPWLHTTKKLMDLSEYGVTDSEALKEVQNKLAKSLKRNLEIDLGKEDLNKLLKLLKREI